MFIRPIGSVVNPSQRPTGRPLLRGILARGAYVWDAAQHPPASPPTREGASPGTPPSPPAAPAARPATPGPATARPAGDRPAPPAGSGAPGPAAPGADLTDRLTQLAALAREGLLTPEEFSAAKARLLAG